MTQNKYEGKPQWFLMADELWESDGCHPDAEQLVRCMQEFRSDSGISDFYFVDVSQDGIDPIDNPELYLDEWNDYEPRPSWECGPETDDLDYTGLPESESLNLEAAEALIATCRASAESEAPR